MNIRHRTLLNRVVELETTFAATKRPDAHGFGVQKVEWDETQEFGPRIADLHTSGGDAERMFVRRTLNAMEAAGLVELSAPTGRNVTRVKSTAKGKAELDPAKEGV